MTDGWRRDRGRSGAAIAEVVGKEALTGIPANQRERLLDVLQTIHTNSMAVDWFEAGAGGCCAISSTLGGP